MSSNHSDHTLICEDWPGIEASADGEKLAELQDIAEQLGAQQSRLDALGHSTAAAYLAQALDQLDIALDPNRT